MGKEFLVCGESCRKVLSMTLIGLSRLHGIHEERELWSGSTPQVKKGYVSYEVVLLEEGEKPSPFQGGNAVKHVIKVLHGPEDPIGETHRFRVTLGYYYISGGRAIHLKRDIYRVDVRGIEGGALVSLKLEKGLSRIGYDELISKIMEKAQESSWESKIVYASFPDEISSCR